MNGRHNELLKIRPKIKKVKDFPNMSDDERFQNETIRPILKLQNPLFILVFKNYIQKRKRVFYDLSLDEAADVMIDQTRWLVKTDKMFKTFLSSWSINYNSWKQLGDKVLFVKYANPSFTS